MSTSDSRARPPENPWELVHALNAGRISDAGFYTACRTTPNAMPGFALDVLTRASEERDEEALEFALYCGFKFALSPEPLPLLLHLAEADWHKRHEDIVSALAEFKAPSSVDTLYRTALSKHDYLDYDEAFALGVKCIWGLGSIDCAQAVTRLGYLLRCGNEVLEENAMNQLKLMRDEATSEGTRAAASARLARESTP